MTDGLEKRGDGEPPNDEKPGALTATDRDVVSTDERATSMSLAGPPRRARFRWLRRMVLLVGVPVLFVVAASWWYATTGRYVITENAYVKSHVIAVSTDLDGRVIDVGIRNNQPVRRGDVLFRLDPDPHWLALQLAQADVETVRNEILAIRAEFGQARAEILEAQERVSFFEREAVRQRDLAGRGISTRSRLDETEFELAAARQRVNALREKVRRVLADLGGDPERAVELHPRFVAAMADVELAELRLADTEVRAPTDGVVTQVSLEPGEWVEEGEPIFGLVAVDSVWIVANLKETQLTHVREGQQVEVSVDAFPDQSWAGRVSTISPATGAEFAVLPPQNASGNWVKVVQRIPVRIDLEPQDRMPILRAGMTATISIDTERERHLLGAAREAIAALVQDRDQP